MNDRPERYSDAAIYALAWFDKNGPASLFSATAPTSAMRRALEKRGLIEPVPDPRPVHLVSYRLTEKARQVLRDARHE